MNATQVIVAARRELGSDLHILGHHYQNDAVLAHADQRGDSLELARGISGLKARFIVFCGVFFMAESAAILASDAQQVHTPRVDARCVMAEMAPARLVESVLARLRQGGRRVTPLTYVNSSAEVKALCGRFGGSVCTSANAGVMLRWALSQGEGVLFLPDKNLARNTADALGLPESRRLVLDVRQGGGMIDAAAADRADLLIWPGCCAIHQRFRLEQVREARKHHPGCTVLAHPECSPEVVRAADGAGSTTFLIKSARQAAPGATLVIGTEVNLVRRLAAEHAPGKTVLPLFPSACSNMAKTTETSLALLLDRLRRSPGPDPVRVSAEVARDAARALTTMLEVCA